MRIATVLETDFLPPALISRYRSDESRWKVSGWSQMKQQGLLIGNRCRGVWLCRYVIIDDQLGKTEGHALRTNVAPDGCYVFNIIRPQYWVYRSSEALYGYPNGKRASADVPRLEHISGHRQKNKYACREICNGDEGVSRIHVESLWVRTLIARLLLYE